MRHKSGLFETMRYYNSNIVCLDEHIKRLKASAKLIGLNIPYSVQGLKLLINKAIKKNGCKDQRVKLVAQRVGDKLGLSVTTKKYLAYPKIRYYKGFSAVVSQQRQDESSLSCHVKALERPFYEQAYSKAKAEGYDEAIILNHQGFIAEGSRSNIFLVRDRKIFTPALECGCLAGITRRVIFSLAKKNNLKVYEGKFTVSDLCQADEAFLTNSLIGVMPIGSVDKQKVCKGRCGKITGKLIEEYKKLWRGGG